MAVPQVPEENTSNSKMIGNKDYLEHSKEAVMQVTVNQTDDLVIHVSFLKVTHVFKIHIGFWDKQEVTSHYLRDWILLSFKQIKGMDRCKEIKLDYQNTVDEQISELLLDCLKTLNETKKKCFWAKNKLINNEWSAHQTSREPRCLFVNVDDNDYGLAMYQNILAKSDKTLLLNVLSGFDPQSRQWKTSEIPLDIHDLISYIFNNNISVFVTLNTYVFEIYRRKYSVLLDKVLEDMGVNIVCYDIDPFSSKVFAELTKRLYTGDNVYRQTFMMLDHLSDERYAINKKLYTSLHAVQFDQSNSVISPKKFPAVGTQPKIIILSNLRLLPTLTLLPKICWLHNRLSVESPLLDYQDWFHTLSAVLAGSEGLDDYSLDYSLATLNNIAYHYGHLYKVLAVEGLKEDYEIEIYGDQSWATLFPELYQNKHVSGSEKAQILAQKNSLVLMFNWNDTWLSASNVIHHLINKIPFVNFPPHVILPEYEPLNSICYHNVEDLKNKISQGINFNQPESTDSMNRLLSIMHSSWGYSATHAIQPTQDEYKNPFSGEYGQELKRHQIEKNKRIESFINNQPDLVERSIDLINPRNNDLRMPELGVGKFKAPIFRRLSQLFLELKNNVH